MTIQEAKQVLDWIAEGKCEYKHAGTFKPYPNDGEATWLMSGNENFSDYRRAPEPKLRPWKPEEGVGKVVKIKSNKNITTILGFEASIGNFVLAASCASSRPKTPAQVLLECEQLDGSPCGVQE